MAGIAAPNIVKDGLVFYIDAMNLRTWSGPDSSTVNSLVGSATGSIAADTSGSFGNNNSFTFDGVDDKISIPPDPLATEARTAFTVSTWIKRANTSNGIIFNNSSLYYFGWYFYGTSFRVYLYNIQITIFEQQSDLGLDNTNWNNIAIVMDTDNSIEKLYVNGITKYSDTSPRNYKDNTNPLLIGEFNGDIGPTKMYSKALSAQEVKQNYNALKGRFGL